MPNIIALIDCDSFFVSCEQAVQKELKGKPVCVTGGIGGCVVSRSREAKKMGVPMGAPTFMVKREFPKCIFLEGHKELYKEYSNKVMKILEDFSPCVEICSIDEAYIDLTGLKKLYKMNYYNMAKFLKEKILEETDIPVSIGISSTKTLAKFASDYAKNTGGIYLIGKSKIKKILSTTKIEQICGVGRRMKLALNKEGIITCEEFIQKSDEWLKNKFSITYVELKHELLGENIYKINNKYEAPKSIQETSTFAPSTNEISFLKNEINKHIKDACRKLRKHNGKTSNVGLMLKTKDFIVYSDKKNLPHSTNSELEISHTVFEIFEKIYNKNLLYRSTGVWFNNLNCTETTQTCLFNANQSSKMEALSKSIDKLEAKFGKNTIKTGFM